jgi:endoglucanase Acf2
MVHRYLSMDINYIDIVNYVQKINPTNKKQIYSIYREMIPKRKVWLKYIKNESKKNPEDLAAYVADYFECSLGEADHYIDILGINIRTILWEMGIEEKETDKLLKHL